MKHEQLTEGQIYQTPHGQKVRIISTELLSFPKGRIRVFNIDFGFCFYIHPESLKPL